MNITLHKLSFIRRTLHVLHVSPWTLVLQIQRPVILSHRLMFPTQPPALQEQTGENGYRKVSLEYRSVGDNRSINVALKTIG